MTIDHNLVLRLSKRKNIYPWQTLMISLLFILTAPFVNRILMWIPFLIQLFRIVQYNEHIFMADIALLVSLGSIFRLPIGGAIGFLVAAAAIWYTIKNCRESLDYGFGIMSVLVIYLLFRSNGALKQYIFIATSLLLMYIMARKCTPEDSISIAKAFVIGILIASIYGFIFRGSSAISYYIAENSIASVEFADRFRFRAIFGDSNYYSAYLILAMLLVQQLYLIKEITVFKAMVVWACLSCFGIMTYSRTFFLMLVLFSAALLFSLFKNHHYIPGILFCILTAIIIIWVLQGKITIFNVVISRLLGSGNLHNLTSGRNDLLVKYGTYIFQNTKTLLIGEGLSAKILGTKGTHNLYLEILYYIGSFGLILMSVYLMFLIRQLKKRYPFVYSLKERFSAFLPLCFFLVIYFTLQGMFSNALYIQIFVALSACLLQQNRMGKTMK